MIGTLARWLSTDESPPLLDRVVVFSAGLAALAGVAVATNSEPIQLLLLLVLIFIAYPLASRVNPRAARDPVVSAMKARNPPLRVLAFSMPGMAALLALDLVVLADSGLGAGFRVWAVVVPWAELYRFLARRDLSRRGGAGWSHGRPLRDSARAAALAAPLILVILLLAGAGSREAVITALAAALLLFLIAFVASPRPTEGRPNDP